MSSRMVPACARGVALSLAVFLLAAPAAARPATAPGATVVLLSLDGMRHDYPDRVPDGTFARLEREGVRAGRLIPPFPASTFPSHATLATGCRPDRHGILNSRFRSADRGDFDRSGDPGWLGCEPIWSTAERQGVPAAVSNWVGSYGAWRGTAATDHDRSFANRTDRESVQRVRGWLRRTGAHRPRLILAYLTGPDHAGHHGGPESPAVTSNVRYQDRLLGEVLRAIGSHPDGDRTSLLVVSDHGMVARQGSLDPIEVFSRRRVRNRTFLSGGSGNVYLPARSDRRAAARLLRFHLPGLEVFLGGDLPADLHYDYPGRTGDLVLLAPMGIELGPVTGGEESGGGLHGYRGEEEAMGGIFYAWGWGIRRGKRVEAVRAEAIYALVCRLLGLRPSGSASSQVPAGILTSRPENR